MHTEVRSFVSNENRRVYSKVMLNQWVSDIEYRIDAACKRANRPRESVLLVAVTKTISPDRINEAIALGLTDIGENRVQEYLGKRDALRPHRFHLVGHLQRNKVKHILPYCHLIHSVDSVAIAQEIDKRSQEMEKQTDILLEINISDEASKYGFSPETLLDVAAPIFSLSNVRVRGLMTVAEWLPDPEMVRPAFRRMKELLHSMNIAFNLNPPMTQLSMGMTGDFEVAIEEGATILRIGTGLFGERMN